MKLIIDIEEKTYRRIQALVNADFFEHDICGYSMQRIANGIPYEEKPKYFPPCEDCNKKMEEIRQAYDKMKAIERSQGEWIIVKDERYGDNVKCPFCGKELAGTDLNFCCKCGAKLIGSEKINGGAE